MNKLIFILFIAILSGCGSAGENETEKTSAQPKAIAIQIPVSVKTLAPEKFNHYIEISGTIEALNIAFISPEMNGQIKEILVREGDRVIKDQPLVRLNTSILNNQIKEVQKALELAAIVYTKQKNLWNQQIGSEIDFLTAKNGKESLERSLETLNSQLDLGLVKSPFDGIVDDIILKVGELAVPGSQLMQIVNLDNLYINADLAETYLASVKKGDKVHLSFAAYPDLNMITQIYRIGNIIHPMNRTINVQIQIKNKNEMLKPNGLAIIKINDFSSEKALVVPSIILKQDTKGSFLYVATKKNTGWFAQKRYVQIGISFEDQSMIDSGLAEGEKVIVKGFTQTTDGSAIKITQ